MNRVSIFRRTIRFTSLGDTVLKPAFALCSARLQAGICLAGMCLADLEYRPEGRGTKNFSLETL